MLKKVLLALSCVKFACHLLFLPRPKTQTRPIGVTITGENVGLFETWQKVRLPQQTQR
jgi:hypothetical protein